MNPIHETANANASRQRDRAPACDEPVRLSRKLCEIMLRVLGRDNELRHAYVRRRWQGSLD